MKVVVAEAFWTEFDAVWKEHVDAGRDAAGFHDTIVDVLQGFQEMPERHPFVHEDEDPLHLGFRYVRTGNWRIIFWVRADVLRVLGLRHVRERTREVPS